MIEPRRDANQSRRFSADGVANGLDGSEFIREILCQCRVLTNEQQLLFPDGIVDHLLPLSDAFFARRLINALNFLELLQLEVRCLAYACICAQADMRIL